jgi:threonine-phosphate decarboxylase
MLRGHGGNSIDLARQLGCAPEEIIDMSSNINPLGPPPGLIQYLKHHIDVVGSFPEVDAREISKRFAGSCGIDPDRVLAGNGTTQIIYSIPQALEIRRALIVGPTYSDYADACHLHNVKTTFAFAEASKNFQTDINQMKTRLDKVNAVFVCNPNNPTGSLISPEELKSLCRSYPETYFIIDESYLPFVPGGEALSLRRLDSGNLLVLSSISKIFAIPGLRIGFVISAAEIIKKFQRFLQPWSVNSLAQLAVGHLTAIENGTDAFIEKTQRYIRTERRRFLDAAKDFSDIHLFPSTTNFMLAQLPYDLQAEDVIDQLARDKILIRNCHNFNGLSNRHVRISLKNPEANRLLAEKLSAIVRKTTVEAKKPDAKIRIAR